MTKTVELPVATVQRACEIIIAFELALINLPMRKAIAGTRQELVDALEAVGEGPVGNQVFGNL